MELISQNRMSAGVPNEPMEFHQRWDNSDFNIKMVQKFVFRGHNQISHTRVHSHIDDGHRVRHLCSLPTICLGVVAIWSFGNPLRLYPWMGAGRSQHVFAQMEKNEKSKRKDNNNGIFTPVTFLCPSFSHKVANYLHDLGSRNL